ncbi:hypothetical protein LTR28_009871, partial [Elasticomyces elasticus]
RYLAELTRKLKRARHKKMRFVDEWSRLLQHAHQCRQVLDSSTTQRLDFGKALPSAGLWGRITLLTPYTRYLLHTHVIPALKYAFGAILALASISIIWSEIAKSISPKLSLVGMTVVHHPNSSRGEIGFAGQLVAAAWLLYMCTTALYSVSEVKVWGNRALVKRQTYAESACWYSLQVAKLTVPLSYNFITMMPPTIYKETAFYKFLGRLINLTPLGSGFSSFFPIFILVPVCATLFSLYSKVKNVTGFGVLEDESEENASGFGTGGWREGQGLIERELLSDQNSNMNLASRSDMPLGTPTPPQPQPQQQRQPHRTVRPQRYTGRSSPPPTTAQAAEGEENSDRYFFQDLGQRVRNTFDTVERPDWVRSISQSFTTPKWMSNDERDQSGDSTLGRLFGGRPADGRVRL